MSDEKLLRQEVEELTKILRQDKQFAQLSKLLESRGVNPADTLLGGYFEDEEGSEYGLLVTSERAISFKRDTKTNKMDKWEEAPLATHFSRRFAAAAVAQRMAKK